MNVDRLLPADALKPRWSSASALLYIGGFVVLFSTAALLGILGELHGEAALVGYSAIAAVVGLGLAVVLQTRERPVAAGVVATLAVVFFAVVVAALLSLIGLLDGDDDGYQPATHLVEIAIVAAALFGLRRFRAPLLVLPIALTLWITIGDLASSASSWANAEETASLAVGAMLAVAGVTVDRSSRRPYGFWLHAVGGIAFGGGLLSLVSDDAGWALVGVLSLAYVTAAYWLERSSYAVLGAVGILAATTYFSFDALSFVGGLFLGGSAAEGGIEPWQVALWFVCAGLLIGLLGLVGDRLGTRRLGDGESRPDRDELVPDV
jgi:hypothetical protein